MANDMHKKDRPWTKTARGRKEVTMVTQRGMKIYIKRQKTKQNKMGNEN